MLDGTQITASNWDLTHQLITKAGFFSNFTTTTSNPTIDAPAVTLLVRPLLTPPPLVWVLVDGNYSKVTSTFGKITKTSCLWRRATISNDLISHNSSVLSYQDTL
jgi:hypothetical protein